MTSFATDIRDRAAIRRHSKNCRDSSLRNLFAKSSRNSPLRLSQRLGAGLTYAAPMRLSPYLARFHIRRETYLVLSGHRSPLLAARRRLHEPGEIYAIGADMDIGVRDGDWSVDHVLDSEKRQVAVSRAQVHPDYLADILAALGRYYNGALPMGPSLRGSGSEPIGRDVGCLGAHRVTHRPSTTGYHVDQITGEQAVPFTFH